MCLFKTHFSGYEYSVANNPEYDYTDPWGDAVYSAIAYGQDGTKYAVYWFVSPAEKGKEFWLEDAADWDNADYVELYSW